MKYVVALALAVWPCSAFAAPVYLKCQLDPNAKGVRADDQAAKAPMDVTLNEDEGTVTYKFTASGRSYTVRGAFTVDKVEFNGFLINRVNLLFQREFFGKIDSGQCTLAEIKRAF